MAGGIGIIIVGFMFGWMLGCIPFLTLATLLWPRLQFSRRLLISLVLSTLAMFAVIWASASSHNGRAVGLYVLVMVMASVVGAIFLLVRWVVRKQERDFTGL